ncbi:hypothetical protein BH10CYA1_BH10CYA1_13820 [soil metagenome]
MASINIFDQLRKAIVYPSLPGHSGPTLIKYVTDALILNGFSDLHPRWRLKLVIPPVFRLYNYL